MRATTIVDLHRRASTSRAIVGRAHGALLHEPTQAVHGRDPPSAP